jgi:hypothetical protein
VIGDLGPSLRLLADRVEGKIPLSENYLCCRADIRAFIRLWRRAFVGVVHELFCNAFAGRGI